MLKKLRKLWHNDLYFCDLRRRRQIDRICSWIQNEALKEQNLYFDDFELYQYFKMLHEMIQLHKVFDENRGGSFVRVGNENDGGYVMWSPFSEKNIAYSIGICTDISWDLQMAGLGYEIFQYDHTIKKLPRDNERFHYKKIGLTGGEETHNLKRLSTILSENHHNECGMVLKMDIEGAEWEVFGNAGKELDLFDQIVVEFHGIIDARKHVLIMKALSNIAKTHLAVHIHGNNFDTVSYCGRYITPNTIEVTFLNKRCFRLEKCKILLPRSEDHPCNPLETEIWLGDWNPI